MEGVKENIWVLVTDPALTRTISNTMDWDKEMIEERSPAISSETNSETSICLRELATATAAISLRNSSRFLEEYQTPMGFSNRQIEVSENGMMKITEEDKLSQISGDSTISLHLDAVEHLENVYEEQRDDMVTKKGFIFTPLHIVKVFAMDRHMDTHIEHYILKHPSVNKIIYRVDILVGSWRGTGQCTRRQLAKQLAAMDLIEKLKMDKTVKKIVPNNVAAYGLLPGWRIDQLVYWVFKDVCKEYDLPCPEFSFKAKEHELGKCAVSCQIGNYFTTAENDLPWLAKKLAIKQMIELITEQEYRLDGTVMGNRVLGFPEMKLLGFKPQMSSIKRKWIMEHRVKETQVVFEENEPNDGEMEDVEKEVQIHSSKRIRMDLAKGTLKIIVPNQIVTSPPSTSVGVSRVPLWVTIKNDNVLSDVEEED